MLYSSAIVFATGSAPRKLGVAGEQGVELPTGLLAQRPDRFGDPGRNRGVPVVPALHRALSHAQASRQPGGREPEELPQATELGGRHGRGPRRSGGRLADHSASASCSSLAVAMASKSMRESQKMPSTSMPPTVSIHCCRTTAGSSAISAWQ